MARHNEFGKWGEDLAVETLVSKGYAIVERNWRLGHLEIDVVALKDDKVVFVEVKTRADKDIDPFDAIDRKKILNLVRAANAYTAHSNMPHDPQFDIIAVCGTPDNYEIEHLEDAFMPPLKTY